VDEAVVVAAQADEVVQVGAATPTPVDEVVDLGPADSFTAGRRLVGFGRSDDRRNLRGLATGACWFAGRRRVRGGGRTRDLRWPGGPGSRWGVSTWDRR
jgi:hypothetical protein